MVAAEPGWVSAQLPEDSAGCPPVDDIEMVVDAAVTDRRGTAEVGIVSVAP